MTKTVVPSAQVAHLWANQSQPSARNGRGSMYFEGDTIYSYGPHYPIARIRPSGAILFNDRPSTVTTNGKHKNAVRRAIGYGESVLRVADPSSDNGPEHLAYADSKAKSLIARLPKCSTSVMLELAQAAIDNAQRIASEYGIQYDAPVIPGDVYQGVLDRTAKREAELEAKRQAKLAWLAKTYSEQRAAWLAGQNVRLPWGAQEPVLLRIKPSDSGTVQTSRGAEFPLSDGVKALPLIRKMVRDGKSWHRNGEQLPVGGFQVDHVDAQGNVKAGCHLIPAAEIERLATLIGA